MTACQMKMSNGHAEQFAWTLTGVKLNWFELVLIRPDILFSDQSRLSGKFMYEIVQIQH